MLLGACAQGENSGVDLLKQAVAEAKSKARVQMRVKLNADDPSAVEQSMLRSLENATENQNVGRLVSSGFEPGYMTLTVEVENTADAIEKLRDIARASGLTRDVTFRVM